MEQSFWVTGRRTFSHAGLIGEWEEMLDHLGDAAEVVVGRAQEAKEALNRVAGAKQTQTLLARQRGKFRAHFRDVGLQILRLVKSEVLMPAPMYRKLQLA